MTTSISSYKIFQKLHPLSLLSQLSDRQVTGCLNVLSEDVSWSIYLDKGKLTYASYSDRVLERFQSHLERLNHPISNINSTTYEQMQLMLVSNNQPELISQSEYQFICWLVDQEYITPAQAGMLVEELAKEVIESFLCLKAGNYKLQPDNYLNELPKFSHLDLRLIVKHCQKYLLPRPNTQPTRLSADPLSTYKQPEEEFNYLITQTKENNQLSSQKKTFTIACIDDSQTVLNSINHFLDNYRFSVVMINDPIKALMQIIRSKPDLILLDVEMPNLDGYELCSLLRRHSSFKNTPIIMVTGRSGFIDRAKAKIVRASGYLTKPFKRSDLIKIVFKHMR
ncbi:response regulator [Cronbergia sp. UHCC 0137]|uniref:response regulator n=1 Tax=Cronbergia sp. UHCC 0137 TaxID=3110239 RepID=UPI003A4C6E40